MNWVTIKSQAELDAALTTGGGALDIACSLRVVITTGKWTIKGSAGFKASVVAWENSSVVARENSSVVARENSSVVAWENSSVEAWENSSVVAWGNVFVRLFAALRVKASASVAIMIHGKAQELDGGRQLNAMKPDTPATWCEFYGVTVVADVATLYKSVDDDYSTDRARRAGIFYRPGEMPIAPDWDGGVEECGGGLHASPHPKMAKYGFNTNGTHAIACPVKLEDICVHPNGSYPEKVKFRGCCAPVFEVDWDGLPLTQAVESREKSK